MNTSTAMDNASAPQSNDVVAVQIRPATVDTLDQPSLETLDKPIKKVRFFTEVRVAEPSHGQEYNVSQDQRYVANLKSAGVSTLQEEGRG